MALSEHPGIGRLTYLLWSILVYPLLFLGMFAALWLTMLNSEVLNPETSDWLWHMFYGVICLVLLIITIMVKVLRLRNLGMSGWWIVAYMLPFLNLWLYWRMLACPAGYADHKQLDLAGKILTFILLLPILILLAAIVLGPLLSLLGGV